LEGRVDWENGVVGDVMLADVLATPFALVENDVVSWGGGWFAVLAGVGGLCIAERAIYVSRHFATKERVSATFSLSLATNW